MDERKVSDVPGVTDLRGASLDDVVDVLARTNRGILNIQRMLNELTTAVATFFAILFLAMYLKVRA